jgi:hypothetical protein
MLPALDDQAAELKPLLEFYKLSTHGSVEVKRKRLLDFLTS